MWIKTIIIFTFAIGNTWAVCISNKLAMDINCKCKKNNSCLKFTRSGIKNEIGFSIKNSDPEKVKKVYKYVVPAYTDMNKIFDGTKTNKDYKNIDIEKISKDTQKLQNINKKLIKSLEKQYQKQNKKFSFDKYKQYYNKQVKNSLKKEIRETNQVPKTVITKALGIKVPKVKGMGIPGIDAGVSQVAAVNSNAGGSTNREQLEKETENKIKAVMSDKSLSEEEKNRRIAIINAEKMKNKNFRYDDILPKHKKIFEIISARYRVVSNRLDQKAIFKDRLEKERENGVNYMIDSFLN